ncbi:MAG: phosphatase PAP2 family protein [Pseudomonadota bacterium]
MGKAKSVSKKVQRADRNVAAKAGKRRDTALVQAIGTLSEIGDQPPMVALGVATLLGSAVRRDAKLARTGLRMLAAHALATGAKTVLKRNIDRTRPHAPLNGGVYKAKRGHSHDPALNSFPSGHTAGAVAVARAVARAYPQAAPAALAGAGAIAAVQVPRAQHYVSDITAGLIIGLASEWLASRALDAAERAWRARS